MNMVFKVMAVDGVSSGDSAGKEDKRIQSRTCEWLVLRPRAGEGMRCTKEPRVHQHTNTLSLDTREAESEEESRSSSTSKVLGNKGYGREQALSSPSLERDDDLERWFPPREE